MRRCCGCMVRAGSTGSVVKCAPEPRPDCDLSKALAAEARRVSTALSLCWSSSREAAKYCQPCFHSPGSVSVACSGRFPVHTSSQLGHCLYPASRTRLSASSASCRAATGSSSPVSCRKKPSARSGLRVLIIGKVSAHDAQYAAGEVRSAERKPAPPHSER